MRLCRFLIVPLLAAGLSACGDGGSEPATVRGEGLELRASVAPAALRVGKNKLELELRDAAGKPVEGARVEAAVRMHAMGAMPAMGGPTPVKELGGGRYQADFELEMGGTWTVEMAARAPSGASARAEGSLTVGSEGLRLVAANAAPAGEPAPTGAASPDAAAAEHPAAFSFPPERLQQIGVRTTRVEQRPLAITVRAVARVAFDEGALADISLKVSGWIESLAVDAVGDPVRRGQVLFTLYSPQLYAAQLELQQALRSSERARASGQPDRAGALARAAQRRLALLGIAEADMAEIAVRSEALEALPIRAPASGFVVEKSVVLGAAVNAGERLLRIAPLAHVWLEAEVFESELPLVREGQIARVRLPNDASQTFEGRVIRIDPMLSERSRTARLRIALDNPGLTLRPDMWANVELDAERGEGLVVPSSALLRAGERSFVFVAKGGGRFEPRAVDVGMEMEDGIEVRGGLVAGDEVVSSGTFLIASESRLRAALSQW